MEGSRLESRCKPKIFSNSHRNLKLKQAFKLLKESCFDCKAIVITEIISSSVQLCSVMFAAGVKCRDLERSLK